MTNEELGQELDRWQLIARDLIEELSDLLQHKGLPLPEWAKDVWEELAEMPEMRINK